MLIPINIYYEFVIYVLFASIPYLFAWLWAKHLSLVCAEREWAWKGEGERGRGKWVGSWKWWWVGGRMGGWAVGGVVLRVVGRQSRSESGSR
jgi:hypothetical protein